MYADADSILYETWRMHQQKYNINWQTYLQRRIAQTKSNEDGNKSNMNRQLKCELQSQKNAEGLFCCNQCHSRFTRKSHLKTHIQSKHKGGKVACNHCEYQATRKDHLRTHIQSKHKGVKYACNKCDKKYSGRSDLHKHIKSRHGGVYWIDGKSHTSHTFIVYCPHLLGWSIVTHLLLLLLLMMIITTRHKTPSMVVVQ